MALSRYNFLKEVLSLDGEKFKKYSFILNIHSFYQSSFNRSTQALQFCLTNRIGYILIVFNSKKIVF